MNRNRVMGWAIVILIATNMATVISGVRHSTNDFKSEEMRDNMRIMFLSNHLQLNEEQTARFVTLNKAYNQNARQSTAILNRQRIRMIEELSKENPDMEKVEKISVDIGSLHKDLKMATADFYLGLKRECNKEQQESLKEFFKVVSDPAGDPSTLRGGAMRQRGWGKGSGPGRGNRGNFIR